MVYPLLLVADYELVPRDQISGIQPIFDRARGAQSRIIAAGSAGGGQGGEGSVGRGEEGHL